MHVLEPYYNWRHLYIASEDEYSPFYGYQNSETEFTHAIYNFVIHPQWDSIDSPTLFMKVLYVNYNTGVAVIELIGEWNDTHYDDVRNFKETVIDPLLDNGVNKHILIGENVLILHPDDDSYYEQWFDDCNEQDGWVTLLNFRDHVLQSFEEIGVDQYFISGGTLTDIAWRTKEPETLFEEVDSIVSKRLA
jgi:hypothetical protein